MKIKLSIVLVLSFILCVSNLFSQEAPAADKMDPKAVDVVKKYADMLLKAKNVKFNMDMNVKIQSKGMNQEISTSSEYIVEKPNKLFYNIKNGMMPLKVVSDGKEVLMFVPSANKYSIEPAQDKLENMACMQFVSKSSGFPVIDPVISDKPYEKFIADAFGAKYLGTEKVGDKDCHHLVFQKQNFDMDAWFETGDKPFLRKIIPDMKKQMEKVMEKTGQKDMKYEMTVLVDKWAIDSTLPADTFKIEPPADAKKIEPPTVGKKPGMQAQKEEEKHPSLGKDAPPFKLELLDGGKLDLAAIKGKKIIVLDFWATWCPPCRKALPIIAEVTASYADKGVAFYAVNLQEDKDKITEFLTKQNIKCPVALDKESEVAKLYNVEGIPQSVIIGKDGIVQVVHVGLSPNLKDDLKSELEDLIAGKSLVKDEKK